MENLEITMEINAMHAQLNITFITTGGPATNVTWTRDDSDNVSEGTETVLEDRVTSQYSHTLTVTETNSYLYTYNCNVSNNKPSSVTISYKTIYMFPHAGMSMHMYIICMLFVCIIMSICTNLTHRISITSSLGFNDIQSYIATFKNNSCIYSVHIQQLK